MFKVTKWRETFSKKKEKEMERPYSFSPDNFFYVLRKGEKKKTI
jgi:hypothetical protein